MKKQDKVFPSSVSSLERMISDIQARNRGSVGRIAESSFFRIPAVTSFKIELSEQNELLRGTGLDRKLPSKRSVVLQEGNNELNIYMENKILKLREYLRNGRPDLFWKLVDHEMKRSIAFRVAAFNKVHKGWYRDMPLERVYQITYGMNKIIEKSLTDLKYFRVEIPKDGPKALLQWYLDNPGGKYNKTRPLGVPTAPWRVILHLWNGFLVLFVEEELKLFNHAYTPGVGTKTCLTEWVNKVLPAKYVYEFDIKGFFNNVSINLVMDILKEKGMPGKQATHLNDILWAAPDNLDLDKEKPKTDYDTTLAARKLLASGRPAVIEYVIPEKPVYDMQAARYAKPEELDIDRRLDLWNLKYSIVEGKGKYVMLRGRPVFVPLLEKQMFINDGRYQSTTETILTAKGPMKRVRLVDKMSKGLPQGAAPSTTLSLLALVPWYKALQSKGINLLMYADDGFLYSDVAFEPFPPDGLEFALEKCAWVKRQGNFVKDQVKFLGVVWDATTKLISAKTRELSRLMFENRQLEVIDSYLSLDTVALAEQSREEHKLNTSLDIERHPDTMPSVDNQTKLDFFLNNAGYSEDVDQSPNSTSKSFSNYLKAARDTAAALGDSRMLKLVNSGIWGQALSKLYGGTWSRLFFPEKAQYNRGSWWDLFYDINQLARDKRLQRLASTWACKWLIQHMSEMTGSVHKARKHATWSLRFFKPDKSQKLMFKDLRNALMMEYYWDEKNLSLVPLELEGCHSFNSNLPEPEWLSPDEFDADNRAAKSAADSLHHPEMPIRMTPVELRVLRRNLSSKRQRSLTPALEVGKLETLGSQGWRPFKADQAQYEIAAKLSTRPAKEMLKPYVTVSLKERLNKAESLRLHELVWETVYVDASPKPNDKP